MSCENKCEIICKRYGVTTNLSLELELIEAVLMRGHNIVWLKTFSCLSVYIFHKLFSMMSVFEVYCLCGSVS